MTKPKIAGMSPVEIEMEANKNYAWCSCGLSESQPFCDGAHSGTDMKPVVIKSEKDESAWFCLCKHTGNSPYCDGAHSKLTNDDS